MRIEHVAYFKFDELTDDAKEKARTWYRDATASDSFMLEEIYESCKAVFNAAGIKLTDWSLGAYNRDNHVRFDMGDAGELTGARAMAWLENNLFSKLRITREEYQKKRKEYLGYGADYRPGKIEPCPLTGVCYDEDFLDALRKAVKGGDTLNDAFHGLADVCGNLCETETEYQNEDEQVDESIRINEYEFTIDGERA